MAAPILIDCPPDVTGDPEAMAWMDEVDQIDPFFGDQQALQALVRSAPRPPLAAWLTQAHLTYRRFAAEHFGLQPEQGAVI